MRVVNFPDGGGVFGVVEGAGVGERSRGQLFHLPDNALAPRRGCARVRVVLKIVQS